MKILKNRQGLTIIEILVSIMILLPIFSGAMITFVKCIEFSELSRHSSEAVLATRNKITQIENTSFSQVFNTFNNATFTVNDLDGIGVVHVDNSMPDLLEIETVFCWREKNGRLIGEDTNLNGQLDAGEDLDGNGQLNSIVQFTTQISNI